MIGPLWDIVGAFRPPLDRVDKSYPLSVRYKRLVWENRSSESYILMERGSDLVGVPDDHCNQAKGFVGLCAVFPELCEHIM